VAQKGGRFPLELNQGVGHKPEYETLAMYGSNLLNDDLASIVKANEICNNLGIDTISAGATIAYAIECCENGLITRQQTDGLDLKWGNAEAIVALTEKIGRREGFGDVLADGVWAAWEKLGKIGTEYAVHIQGEEIPAHDPKFTPDSTYCSRSDPRAPHPGGELAAGREEVPVRQMSAPGQPRSLSPGGRRGGGQRGRLCFSAPQTFQAC
jgi:aldehyde:ferredoxin oxidoreductase